jgi:hypothetical protein
VILLISLIKLLLVSQGLWSFATVISLIKLIELLGLISGAETVREA